MRRGRVGKRRRRQVHRTGRYSGKEVGHTFPFDGDKEAGGLKHLTRVRWLREDKMHLDLEVSDIRPQEKLDDSHTSQQ